VTGNLWPIPHRYLWEGLRLGLLVVRHTPFGNMTALAAILTKSDFLLAADGARIGACQASQDDVR